MALLSFNRIIFAVSVVVLVATLLGVGDAKKKRRRGLKKGQVSSRNQCSQASFHYFVKSKLPGMKLSGCVAINKGSKLLCTAVCSEGYGLNQGNTAAQATCSLNKRNKKKKKKKANKKAAITWRALGDLRQARVGCQVVDECKTNTHKCHETATCVNEPKGYTCVCKMGVEVNKGESCHANNMYDDPPPCTNLGGEFALVHNSTLYVICKKKVQYTAAEEHTTMQWQLCSPKDWVQYQEYDEPASELHSKIKNKDRIWLKSEVEDEVELYFFVRASVTPSEYLNDTSTSSTGNAKNYVAYCNTMQ